MLSSSMIVEDKEHQWKMWFDDSFTDYIHVHSFFVLNDAFRAALILRIKYRENRIQKINLAISNGRKL